MRKLFTAFVAVSMAATAMAQSRTVKANPPSGSVVTELGTITLESADPDYPTLDILSAGDITVTRNELIDCGGVTAKTALDPIKIVLNETQTAPGNYAITIPRGVLSFMNETSAPVDGMETVLYYTIGDAPAVGDNVVIADPASGSTVQSLQSVIIKSATSDALWDRGSGSIIVSKDGEPFGDVRATDLYNETFRLSLDKEYTEAGVYTISAEAGAFTYENGSDVAAFELVYTVGGGAVDPEPETYEIKATPASGSVLTEPLTSVTIASGEASLPFIEITSKDDITVTHDGYPFGGVKVAESPRGMVLTLQNEVTEGGEYVIHLPKDSWNIFMLDEATGTYNSASFDLDLTYTVDLPGARYTIDILPGKVTPNSVDAPYDLNINDGKLNVIRFQVNGELYLNPDAEAAVGSLVCKKNHYEVTAALRADAPKKAIIGNSYTTMFYLDLDPGVVQDGTYTFSVPRGAFGDAAYKEDQMTGTANREYSLDIEFTGGEPAPEPTVVYDLGVTSTKPAEGVVDLSMITWEVTNIGVGAAYNVRPGVQVTLSNEAAGYSQTAPLREGYVMGATRTMLFTNGKEPTVNGTYVLTIPEGSFGDEEWLADPETGHTNPEIKLYYRVTGVGGTDAEYDIEVATVTPAADGTADISEEPLTVSFTAPGELGFYPNSKLTLKCADANYSGVAVIKTAETADGVTTFTTELNNPVLVNGTYTLSIPEGVFGDAEYVENCATGHGNAAFTSTFTVTGGEGQKEPVKYDLIPEVTPSSDSVLYPGQLDVIVFVFPAGTRPTSDSARATMRCAEANYFDTAYFINGEADGTYELRYGTKPSRDGVYTLTLLEGTFADADDAHQNPEIVYSFDFRTSGIDGILSDEEAAAGVYTVNGVYVGDSTENLPAGIYVLKGRKIVKK